MADHNRTFLALLLAAAPLLAQLAPEPAGPVWSPTGERVVLRGTVHRRLLNLQPLRAVAPDFPMERMLLVLRLNPEASTGLRQLLKDQQDPASPQFHRWLTPDDFGRRFGPSQAQRDAAALWLLQQGFSIQGMAKAGTSITFSGSASQVGKAFGTAIMEYNVQGVVHHGNATDLELPRALAGFVSGVATMHDLRRAPSPRVVRALALPGAEGVQATGSGGSTYIGPGDFATIYNLTPLFAMGITGQGVGIGIPGQTDLPAGDFETFRSTFGLAGYPGTLTTVETGAWPGAVDPGDELEAELDTQWASAAAPGAAVTFAISPSSATTSGIDLSAQYLVDNNQIQVLSLSYGACEADMGGPGSTYVTFYEQLWEQAAGQGISVFVAAGDAGAAGCDNPLDFTASHGSQRPGLQPLQHQCRGDDVHGHRGAVLANESRGDPPDDRPGVCARNGLGREQRGRQRLPFVRRRRGRLHLLAQARLAGCPRRARRSLARCAGCGPQRRRPH